MTRLKISIKHSMILVALAGLLLGLCLQLHKWHAFSEEYRKLARSYATELESLEVRLSVDRASLNELSKDLNIILNHPRLGNSRSLSEWLGWVRERIEYREQRISANQQKRDHYSRLKSKYEHMIFSPWIKDKSGSPFPLKDRDIFETIKRQEEARIEFQETIKRQKEEQIEFQDRMNKRE